MHAFQPAWPFASIFQSTAASRTQMSWLDHCTGEHSIGCRVSIAQLSIVRARKRQSSVPYMSFRHGCIGAVGWSGQRIVAAAG